MTPLKTESANPLASDTQPIAHYKNAGFLVTYCGLRSFHAFCYIARVPNPPYGLCSCKLCIISQDSSQSTKISPQDKYYYTYHIFFLNQNCFNISFQQ